MIIYVFILLSYAFLDNTFSQNNTYIAVILEVLFLYHYTSTKFTEM